MEGICRVCLDTRHLVNIFDATKRRTRVSIADMIALCTGFEVRRGDSYPETICPPCLEDAQNAFNIWQKCKKSNLFFCQEKKDLIQVDGSKNHGEENNDDNQGETFFNCNKCRMTYKRRLPWLRHMRKHSVGGPASSNSGTKLQVHKTKHKDERPYKCTHCSKGFAQSGTLQTHIRTHTGERPFKCSQCGMTFVKSSDMHRHVRTHSGLKPHKCSQCSNSYSRKSHLETHLRTHTGERPFKCSQCSKSFYIKHHLQDHIRRHTGERPFRCSECPKSFNQSNTLKNHLLTHSSKRSFKCPHCSSAFKQRRSLARHISIHD